MKTLFASVIYMLFITIGISSNNIDAQKKQNTVVATFKGITDTDFYRFVAAKNNEILFYDIDEDIEISLYDDDNIDKTFTIVWIDKQIDEYDDEGEATGQKITVKSITSIKSED
jgi:hypothetical protein